METRAYLKGTRLSPQKAGLVADVVRGKSVHAAIDFLTFHKQKASAVIKKLLESAIANAENNDKADIDLLVVKSVIVKPKMYTLQDINNLYDEKYFIKLYCMLRFLEEEDKHTKAKQDLIITDTVNLSRVKDLPTALSYFERFVSQPFDYRGSLSYIVRDRAKREDR